MRTRRQRDDQGSAARGRQPAPGYAGRDARGRPPERDHRRRLHRPRRHLPDARRPPRRRAARAASRSRRRGTRSRSATRAHALARRATGRELLVLTSHLEASLLDDDGAVRDLAAAIAEHEELVQARPTARPPGRPGPQRRARDPAGVGLAARDAPLRRVRARAGAGRVRAPQRGGAGAGPGRCPRAPAVSLRGSRGARDHRRAPRGRDLQARQAADPSERDKGRSGPLLRPDRRGDASPHRRPPAQLRALSRRHRGPQDLSSSTPAAISRTGSKWWRCRSPGGRSSTWSRPSRRRWSTWQTRRASPSTAGRAAPTS